KRLERYGNMMPKYQEAEPEPAPAMQWIEEAIGQLPAQQKKVWLLSRREGKKYAEIAEEMNISRETVKSYLKLANTSIMQQLQQKITVLLAGIGIFEEFLK
ncbi:MAG: sigma-70 family RNA polymerase sigma factor, partial [Chitinophagaceae bacterium]|nr:sigma-70 family RNA polymerase sigma factor [Chitinophagaceae bacterium]